MHLANFIQSIGFIRHHSASSFVTDSAAAGTAFGSGVKTNNGVIGSLPDGTAVGNVLEAASLAGFKTGLVVTSTIFHATPASFSAHVADRDDSDRIAAQQIGLAHPLGHVVDVLMGGGRCNFKPNTDPTSCRKDNQDLLGYAKQNNWTVAQDLAEYNSLIGDGSTVSLPFIGLFADGDLKQEVDRARVGDEPSLLDMSKAAITALTRATKDTEKGYFLMIEASRVDHAAHNNDAPGILHDGIVYNEIVKYIKEHIDTHTDTVVLAAADHETGGLVLPSGYNPILLKAATASAGELASMWSSYTGSDRKAYLKGTILPMYALGAATDAEVDAILAASNFRNALVALLNRKAGIAWATGGHSAIDSSLVAYGNGCSGEKLKIDLAGGHDNTDLAKYMAALMRVDLKGVTEKLKAQGKEGWMGNA